MSLALIAVNLAACLFLIGFAVFSMKKGVTLLNAFVLIFVLCCCLGVSLFEPFAEFLPATKYSDLALARATVANLIFMACAAVALVIEGKLLKRKNPALVATRILPLSLGAKSVVIVASIVVILFQANWLNSVSSLENPFAAYKETGGSGQYYKYRQLVEQDVAGKEGGGSWTAKKLTINVGPFLMILLAYLFYQTKNWMYLVLVAVQGFCGIMIAGVLAHKSFLLVALFSPLLAVAVWKIRGLSAGIVLLILVIGFLLGGALIFQATLNSTIGVAFAELITRVFLTPAFTPLFYYEVVPDALPFRGILESLYIYHVRAPAWDYATFDVAHYATGRAYGANANFLAIAYTGSGFVGVFWVAAVCFGLILLLDYYLSELEPSHRLVAVCCSGFGFVGITSIHFIGALSNGFLLGSLIFYVLCRGVTNRTDHNVLAASGELEPGAAAA